MAPYCPSTAPGVRVVAVAVPRADSAVGRVLAMIDASPETQFSIEELAGRLHVDPVIVRQALITLTGKGLVSSQPSRVRNRTQPIWLYKLAPDYSAHVRAALEAGARR